MSAPQGSRWSVVLLSTATLLFCGSLPRVAVAQTLKLSPTLTIEKSDDKVKTNDNIVALLNYSKAQKLESNVVRFLENAAQQMAKVLDAAKILEDQKTTEVPKEFAPAKYRVKAMPKLQAKKNTAKKLTAAELKKRLQGGKDLDFKEPLLITNATALFEDGAWDSMKRHWSAGRIMADEHLERELKLEYWPPEKARARLVGNMMYMEEPEPVTFSRWVVICFHGTPAKPKLPGQNTEHCEQSIDARSMTQNSTELEDLSIFKEIKNALPAQADFRRRLLEAGSEEITAMLGKSAKNWMKKTGHTYYQFFTFGPSGSGDKLKAENGLPFFDFLIHGSRRWLLMTEEEMERVAAKAREALEFDKTSAYMFFEEKLPELKEEFGLKKYVEINQQAGDVVIVPSGWYRVSLSLADSISYYETLLSDKRTLAATTDNHVWRPQFRAYQLAYCYTTGELHKLPGIEEGSQLHNWLKQAISNVKLDEAISGILSVLFQCGSVLALDTRMPQLGVQSLSTCTPAAWKQCRKQLQVKLKEKGVTATLSWLPKEAPKSVEEVGVSEKAKTDEL